MILISHRGNIDGKNPSIENSPEQINFLTKNNINVEIDIWVDNNKIYLGHDIPDIQIDIEWLFEKINFLWIHCKSIETVNFFYCLNKKFNFFFHQNDDLTLTSHGYIWVYPGKKFTENSIIVCNDKREIDKYIEEKPKVLGICSDYISTFFS